MTEAVKRQQEEIQELLGSGTIIEEIEDKVSGNGKTRAEETQQDDEENNEENEDAQDRQDDEAERPRNQNENEEDEEGEENEEEVLEEDERDETIAQLSREVTKLKSQIARAQREREEDEEEDDPTATGRKSKKPHVKIEELQDQDFVGSLDLADGAILENKEQLNALLNKVYKAGLAGGVENVMLRVPRMIARETAGQVQNHMLVNAFWQANQDLHEHKDYAAVVLNDLYQENPGEDLGSVLQQLGPEVRRRLKIEPEKGSKKSSDKTGKRRTTKAAPGSKGRRTGAPKKPKGIDAEVKELAAAL